MDSIDCSSDDPVGLGSGSEAGVETMMSDLTILSVPDPLKKNLEWYIANQQELSAKYNGRILLIVDQQLVQAFDNMGEAYAEALKSYAPGTFTLQPCSPDADSYTLLLYSPSYSVFA